MARKRGLFFHSISTFLSCCKLLIYRQGQGCFPKRYRLPLAVYSGLAIISLVCATMMPGFASSRIAHNSGEFIAQLSEQTLPDQLEAQQLNQLARDYYDAGQLDDAAIAFGQAATHFQQLGYPEQATASLVNQAEALQGLGLYNQAIVVLQRALQPPNQSKLLLEDLNQQELEALLPSPTTTFALRNLGDALQVVGNLEQAELILQYSLELAKKLSLTSEIGSTYLSLGNLERTRAISDLRLSNMNIPEAIEQLQKQQRLKLRPIQYELQRRQTEAAQIFETRTNSALDYYQQAATNEASSPLIQVQAHLNAISLLLDKQLWSEAADAIPDVYALLDELPSSRVVIDAHINLAHSLMRLEKEDVRLSFDDPLLQAAQLLATAQQQASQLGAPQAESYVLGSLGELYIHREQWQNAKTVTQQALEKINPVSVTNLALTINDVDLAYRWYRQLGKILIAQNKTTEAVEAYETAVELLRKRLRLDVAASNLNSQFSFNEEAQTPIYQELMDLLLRPENPSQKNLKLVRELSSSLLEAELTSFLQEPCNIATPDDIDKVVQAENQKAAIIYPIVLPDRLEVIVKLPGEQELLHYHHFIQEDQLLAQLKNLQLALEEDYTFEAVETLSKKFYDWIIEPAKKSLSQLDIDTLIFTLDRKLQTIPMAALYDGDNYLIKNFAIAEFLGLRVEGANEPLPSKNLKILAAGLSSLPASLPDDVENNFVPLSYVDAELAKIDALEKEDGVRVDTLKNEEFTLEKFNIRLNEDKFPVVHLATHGQFSVDPQSTFLLTSGESNDALVKTDELASLFRVRESIRLDAIELLVLNACETASGDDLATLGIAGTAIRAGARSAIASLWNLNDELSVEFTNTLYKNLQQPGVSKAKALQQAQLALLEQPQYMHPRYWSPYILAGNWSPLISISQ